MALDLTISPVPAERPTSTGLALGAAHYRYQIRADARLNAP